MASHYTDDISRPSRGTFDLEALENWGKKMTDKVNALENRMLILERRLEIMSQEHVEKLLKE